MVIRMKPEWLPVNNPASTREHQLPGWDGSTLMARGKSKTYKRQAARQRQILDAFQDAGWLTSIPNPLANGSSRKTPAEHVEVMAQLRKSVDNLNRSLRICSMPVVFSTDGNSNILWGWQT